MVIGHRGLGKNTASNRSLQLGENTVPSFIAAANLGASYVEFDVQLTKDHIPVIYHDFLVSETGIDAPVHTLTLEQFLHINPTRAACKLRTRTCSTGSSRYEAPARASAAGLSRWGYRVADKEALEERMRHTRDFKQKGFKANSRGIFIQAPFATLEDLFKKVPPSVGFNIEMKYPMLHESEEHEMDTYAVELNSFCDTVLEKSLRPSRQPKRHLLVVQPGHLPLPVVQAAQLPHPVSDRCGGRPRGRHPGQQPTGGDPLCQSVELARHRERVRAVRQQPAAGASREAEWARVRQLRVAKQRSCSSRGMCGVSRHELGKENANRCYDSAKSTRASTQSSSIACLPSGRG